VYNDSPTPIQVNGTDAKFTIAQWAGMRTDCGRYLGVDTSLLERVKFCVEDTVYNLATQQA